MCTFSRQQLSTGVAVFLATLLNLGCSSVGPGKLVSTHEGYNDAVQMAVSREVLKNIVRLRYYDPIQFMRVTAVNANFSVSVGNSAGVTGSWRPSQVKGRIRRYVVR